MILLAGKNEFCNKISVPEFTAEQIKNCKKCRHVRDPRRDWCCFFGVDIGTTKIIQPKHIIIKPRNRLRLPSFIGGCCGKAKNITIGWKRYLQGKSWPWSRERLQICQGCSDITYMTRLEFAAWLAKNNIKVIRNYNQLERLEKLPKKQKMPGTEPYCRICKCNLEAKVLVEAEECKMKRWGPVQ